MEMQTNPNPTTQTAERKVNTTYIFREITEADELEIAFRFRYEVYANCRLSPFLKRNKNKIDIDSFDLHSKHFGIFMEQDELVAYIRVVLDKSEICNDPVSEIIHKFKLNLDSYNGSVNGETDGFDYPFLSYPMVPECVKSHYNAMKSRKEGLAEASRLIIREEFRGPKLSGFLIEGAMVLFTLICNEKRHAVVCCDKHHSFFYERYGFKPFGDGQIYNVSGNELVSVFLTLGSATSSRIIERFAGMAAEYSITGKITKTL